MLIKGSKGHGGYREYKGVRVAAEDTEGTKVATGTRKCRALITCHGVHKGAQGAQGVSATECRVCKEMHGAGFVVDTPNQ